MAGPTDVAAAAHVAADRAAVRHLLARTDLWTRCWPGLVLDVTEDRGLKGVRWAVAGRLAGTAEVWLEPWRETCVAHVYLRPDGVPSRRTERAVRTYGERTRALLFWAKDRLEQR